MSAAQPAGKRYRLVLALGGIALGLGMLWGAFRITDLADVRQAMTGLRWPLVLAAAGVYWAGMALRVLRWHGLLHALRPVSRPLVGELLLCGYAMNNLLPARLGELFRADLAKRRLGLSRTTVLGSIVVERVLDLTAILLCLTLGLLSFTPPAGASEALDFGRMLMQTALLVGVVTASVVWLMRGALSSARLPVMAKRLLADLRSGLKAIGRHNALPLAALTAAIWTAEASALALMFAALGEPLSAPAALIAISTASLSTLVPTAPAYIGSFQLVFATVMPTLGVPAPVGIAASGLVQLCLLGSATLVGLLLMLRRAVHNGGTVAPPMTPSDASNKSG